jgi:DGQHR domain-containing protein
MYNRIFQHKEIKDFRVKVPALKARMGGKWYYSFVLAPEHLLKIAFVHHRSSTARFSELTDSYQRMIDKTRIGQIQRFIEDGGYFPGSIIVNFTKAPQEDQLCDKHTLESMRDEARPVMLTLPSYYGCAWIIDGQHRLYGFANLEQKTTETLPVIAFVNEKSHTQAKIFVDINKNQKAVEANLLWDLYEDLYADSDDERERQLWAISCLAKELNREDWSPFKGHIKIPKDDNPGNLTMYAVCNAIKRLALLSPKEGLLYRQDLEISVDFAARRIGAFFDELRSELPEQWAAGEKGKKAFIRSNAALPVFAGILRDVVALLEAKEVDDISRYPAACRRLLAPLVEHLRTAPSEVIEGYRKAGSLEQSSQVRAGFCRILYEGKVGFRSSWFDEREDAAKERYAQANIRSARRLIDQDESATLEFKGQISLDVDRYLLGDGRREFKPDLENKGVLRSIVGMLNRKGGDLVVGVLEANKYARVPEERADDLLLIGDKLVLGIGPEYDSRGWDGYCLRLTELIQSRIASDLVDQLVSIDKLSLSDGAGGQWEICRISVRRSETKQFLNGEQFYVRRNNKTDLLKPAEIDAYWNSRR